MVSVYSPLSFLNSFFFKKETVWGSVQRSSSLIIKVTYVIFMPRRTSAKVASEAAKVLKDPKATKDEKSAAASALSQRAK